MKTIPAHAAPTNSAEPEDVGVEGNSKLTSTAGVLLLVMLAVEGYTVLNVRGLITLHVFLGVMLLGPVLLKVASTGYRFVRYYTGRAEYVRKGPPHIVLRVLGPLVILSSLALLGTGVGLLTQRPGGGGLLLTAHKASFIIWVAVMTLHVLGHLREVFVVSWREVTHVSPGRRLRIAAIALALVVGVGTAAALLPTAAPWTHRSEQSYDHHRH